MRKLFIVTHSYKNVNKACSRFNGSLRGEMCTDNCSDLTVNWFDFIMHSNNSNNQGIKNSSNNNSNNSSSGSSNVSISTVQKNLSDAFVSSFDSLQQCYFHFGSFLLCEHL